MKQKILKCKNQKIEENQNPYKLEIFTKKRGEWLYVMAWVYKYGQPPVFVSTYLPYDKNFEYIIKYNDKENKLEHYKIFSKKKIKNVLKVLSIKIKKNIFICPNCGNNLEEESAKCLLNSFLHKIFIDNYNLPLLTKITKSLLYLKRNIRGKNESWRSI